MKKDKDILVIMYHEYIDEFGFDSFTICKESKLKEYEQMFEAILKKNKVVDLFIGNNQSIEFTSWKDFISNTRIIPITESKKKYLINTFSTEKHFGVNLLFSLECEYESLDEE